MRDALYAEFGTIDGLLGAIDTLKKQGHLRLDAFTPYPSHEVDHALDLGRSRLPFLVGVIGLSTAAFAYFLQWLLEAYLYPLNVGSRPPHFPLAFIIITFEMGVLGAGLTATVGALALAKLPTLWKPVDEIPGFSGATDDRFWLVVPGRSAIEDDSAAARQLAELAPLQIVRMRDGRVL